MEESDRGNQLAPADRPEDGGQELQSALRELRRQNAEQAVALQRLGEEVRGCRQLVAGLGHEGRNVLQRCQASLERLRWRLQDRPEALDFLKRLQKAQDDLLRLFNTARAYVSPLTPHYLPCDVAEVWREAWHQLTAPPQPPRDARLEETTDGCSVECEADRPRLGEAFRHLFQSALTACPDPVRVRVRCSGTALDGRPALRVAVRDNGPSLSAEQRHALFEPFAATRPRGVGLGLAVAKRIVEAHQGQMAVGQGADPALEIIITLPRRKP